MTITPGHRAWSIYALVDPRDQAVRYIGQTTNPESRYQQHISTLDCWNSWHYEQGKAEPENVAAWITDLRRNQLKPELRILQMMESQLEADYWEWDWITLALLLGWPLVNIRLAGRKRRRVIQQKLGKGVRDATR